MYDELIDESAYSNLPIKRQTELITRYCSDFKNAIIRSTTFSEAEQIASEQCRQFELLCTSTVIQSAIRKYVHNIVSERWGFNGH